MHGRTKMSRAQGCVYAHGLTVVGQGGSYCRGATTEGTTICVNLWIKTLFISIKNIL